MRLREALLWCECVNKLYGQHNSVPYKAPVFSPTVYPNAKGFPDLSNSKIRTLKLSQIFPRKLVFAVTKVDELKDYIPNGEVYIAAEFVKKEVAEKARTTSDSIHGMFTTALNNIAYIQTPSNDSTTREGTIDVYSYIEGTPLLRKTVIAVQGKRKSQIITGYKTTNLETSVIMKKIKNPHDNGKKSP